MAAKSKLSLSAKIFIAMILGAIAGLILNYSGNPEWTRVWLTDGLFEVFGQIFISLLRMLVVPLVFISLVCGASSLSDPKMLGRVGGKTISLYLITTAIAVVLALGAAIIFEPGIGAHPIAIVQTEIAEAMPFTQVLINIVSNAIKFTPKGGTITIDAKLSEKEDQMEISITDTGVGIPKNDLSKIFEKFQQAQNRSSADKSGTGLGLTIAREIIHMHNGKITVNSEENKGTTFMFTLPLCGPS